MTDDFSPSFSPDGKYLYFISRRTMDPDFGTFELNLHFSATDKIYAMTLRSDLPSPVKPQSDEEGVKDERDDESKPAHKGAAPAIRIDLDGIGDRTVELPVAAARLGALRAFDDRLLYVTLDPPDVESDDIGTGDLHCYDLDKREDRTVLESVTGWFAASADGGRVLYRDDETWGVVKTDEAAKSGDGKVPSGDLMATVDPRAEWMQMFDEAWRLERDYYYDPKMGGLDWKAVGARYRQLVPYVAHRADLNYILGELIGELGTSHTYVGGGDLPELTKIAVGLLGADFELDPKSGAYRFRRIYRERDWSSKVAAPLAEPGVNVREGDWLLAVNGQPVQAPQNVYAVFVGTTDHVTRLTVGASPNDPHPRTLRGEADRERVHAALHRMGRRQSREGGEGDERPDRVRAPSQHGARGDSRVHQAVLPADQRSRPDRRRSVQRRRLHSRFLHRALRPHHVGLLVDA